MPLLVPIALNQRGQMALPSCDKSEGPFSCLECSEKLNLRQGEINKWHFAHVTVGTQCRGGGEPLRHRAAKMILVKYMNTINFVQKCRKKRHVHIRRYERCTASQDYKYDGRHVADVAILTSAGTLRAIVNVDISFPFKTRRDPILVALASPGNVWEVNGTTVINSQRKLHRSFLQNGSTNLLGSTCIECQSCARDAERISNARRVISRYLARINFVHTCEWGDHNVKHRYEGCTSSGDNECGEKSEKVVIYQDGRSRAIVKVKVGQATEVRHPEALFLCKEDIWTVDAVTVMNAESRLQSTEAAVNLRAKNASECRACAVECGSRWEG